MGTYTEPDALYLATTRGAGHQAERAWGPKINENFQKIQDIIIALRASGGTIQDVRSFGADPTGATDATAGFADFMDQMNSAPGQVGFIGEGTYSVLPDVLGGVRDDCVIFGRGPASKIVASAAGTAVFDFRNGSTGVQGLRLESFMVDLNNLVPDAVLVDQLASSSSPRLNIARDLTIWRYLRHAIDAGLNGNSQAIHVLGGDFRGSPMSVSPDAEQSAIYFRASDCVAEVRSIIRNRLAGVLIEGSATVRGGHIFASGDVWADGSQPTCILVRKGGLIEIDGVYGDNAFQNAFVVVRPRSSDQPVDRVSIHGGKWTQAVQQRDVAGDLVAATYPLFIFDDTNKRVSAIMVEDVLARASNSSHFTNIVEWSAATASSSICDGNIVEACDDFWDHAPPDVGNNNITDDTSATTVRNSRSAASQRTRSVWKEAFGMGLDTSPTKSTLGTVPDALTRVQLADAATTGVMATLAVPDDAVPGEPVLVRILWGGTVGESGTSVRWSIDAYLLTAAEAVSHAGTTTTFTGDNGAKTANAPNYEDGVQVLAAADPGDVVRVDIRRLGSDGADTYTGIANVVGFWLDYTATS